MACATSTGSPPCCSEFRRREIWRRAAGILAVMSDSMNPGATALMVPPLAAISGAVAATRPITPALEAA